MTREQRSKYAERGRAAGVLMVGVAASPSILSGDIAGVLVTVVAGFVVFYAGAYMGAIGMAPLE